MDISSEEKLGHKLGKDLGYGAGSESDGLLNSHTNTSKAKCFNFDMVKVLSLGPCDFGSAVDDIDIDLSSSVSLKSPFHSVTSVKERFCFEPTKFFTLDIGLSAVPGNTLHNKLKSVRKLFYKVDGFGSVLTPSKFPGIVRMSFTSEFSLTLAKQLVVSKNLVEILVNLPKLAIESALVKYGKIFSIKMQLIGLWQKVLVADLVVSKWSILLDKDSVQVTKANADKQTWNLRDSYCALLYTLPIGTTAHNFSNLIQLYDEKTCCISRNSAAIHSTPVFKSINLVWAGLLSPKYTAYSNFGHVSSGCSSGKKTFGLGFKKRFFCSNSDKKCLVLIYAKKQAPMFCSVSFGGTTWASVVSGFPKNLFSIPFVKTNIDIELVSSLMPKVAILALCVSVLEHLFENVSDQVANISCKLNRLLAVLSASFVVSLTPKHNSVLDMAVDALLFVSPVPSVVTTVTQDIFPSGSRVLTVKVGGLEASLLVLKNSIKTIMNKLDSFGFGSGVVIHFLPQ
ncbi:hypothetical protein G9A89_009230 [Geosiphon pyriformis]|nr:hypothetical protein G9A89_009230 [Geosiphon pyriformis]